MTGYFIHSIKKTGIRVVSINLVNFLKVKLAQISTQCLLGRLFNRQTNELNVLLNNTYPSFNNNYLGGLARNMEALVEYGGIGDTTIA